MIKDKTHLEKVMIRQFLSDIDLNGIADDFDLDSGSHDEAFGLKNLCCKVTPRLSDRVKNAASQLNISQTAFISSALIDALDMFDRLAVDTGWLEHKDFINAVSNLKQEDLIPVPKEDLESQS